MKTFKNILEETGGFDSLPKINLKQLSTAQYKKVLEQLSKAKLSSTTGGGTMGIYRLSSSKVDEPVRLVVYSDGKWELKGDVNNLGK